MRFINPPVQTPRGVTHRTFYSPSYNHEIGYNIYLPPGYGNGGDKYPAAYHLHGWTGDESSEIRPMETKKIIYRDNACRIE